MQQLMKIAKKKKIQQKNNVLILLFAVIMMFLCLPFASLNNNLQKTLANETSVLPIVSLSLYEGNQNGIYASKSTLKVKITASATVIPTNPQIKVRIQTFDISAKAGKHYTSVNTVETLTFKDTLTVETIIPIYVKCESTAIVESQTKVFGVRIVALENCQENLDSNTLILHTNYNGNNHSKDAGFSEVVINLTELDVTSLADDGVTNELCDYVKLLTTSDSKQYKFYSDYKNDLNLYNYSSGTISDKAVISVKGFTYSVRDLKSSLVGYDNSLFYASTGDTKKNWDNNNISNYLEYNGYASTSTDNRKSVTSRVNTSSTVKVVQLKYGAYYSLSGLQNAYVKHFTNNKAHTFMGTDTLPQITGYSVANTTYGLGSEMYISVKFNRVVNITSNEKPKLQTLIGDEYVDFVYYGGNYTNELIFKHKFTEVLASDKVEIIGFANTVYSEIKDIYYNSLAKNNVLNWSSYTNISDVSLSATIDTRIPKVEKISETTNVRKNHSVQISVKDLSSLGAIKYSWNNLQDATTVTSWTNLNNFTLDDEYNTINSTNGLNGLQYLHIMASSVCETYKLFTFGPYQFDNTAPKFYDYNVSNSSSYRKDHTITLNFEDLPNECASGINRVTAKYSLDGKESQLITIYKANETSIATYQDGKLSYNLTFDYLKDIGLFDESVVYGMVNIEYIIYDNLENFTIVNVKDVKIDGRNTFPVTLLKLNTETSFSIGDLYVTNEKEILIKSELGSSYSTNEISLNSIKINNNSISATSFSVIVKDGYLTAKVGLPNVSGYCDIVLNIQDGQSEQLSFYLSNNNETENYFKFYDEKRLLINKVYQFATSYFISYKNLGYGNVYYNEDMVKPIFSSKEKAYEYARFMELQDLEILVLTDENISIRNFLNNGSNVLYQKAKEHLSTVAEIGQTWIKYKSSEWIVNSSYNDSNWVYYLYSDNAVDYIDDNQILNSGSALEKAIESISKKISNYDGEAIYLTVNENRVDSNGEPNYKSKGIYYDDLDYQGNFINKLFYTGDKNIYNSFITINDKRLPIIANYEFDISRFSNLFISAYGRENYKEILNGQTLRDVTSGVSGIYTIIELNNGYRKFDFYADYSAPIVKYSFTNSQNANTQVAYIDIFSQNSEIRVKSLNLEKILLSLNRTSEDTGYQVEYDKYSYIYVQTSKNMGNDSKLITYSLNDFTKLDKYEFTPGIYQIIIADRLGNQSTVQFRVNGDELSVTINEIENVSFTVNINRLVSEIDSGNFKITRNGEVVESEYNTQFTFKQSGHYIITVKDVYGTTLVKEFDFNRIQPQVEILYLNLNGSYTKIEIDDTDNFNLGFALVSKLENGALKINTATNIRIRYSIYSNYKVNFDSGDIEGAQITSNSLYEMVTIPYTEGGWTISVAYLDDIENKLIITCTNDTNKPIISASGSSSIYSVNDESGENILFTKTENISNFDIYNGDKIIAEEVNISWSDESLIYSVEIDYNGNITSINPSEFSSTSVKDVGTYKFIVTDILGNVSIFEFEIITRLDYEFVVNEKLYYGANNPLDYIENDTYTLVEYVNNDIKLVLRDNLLTTFIYNDGERKLIYTIDYSLNSLIFYYYDGGEYQIVNTYDLTENNKGTLATVNNSLEISYELQNEDLILVFPKKEFVEYDFRINEHNLTKIEYVKFEISTEVPNIIFKKTNEDILIFENNQITGVNTQVEIVNDKNYQIKYCLNNLFEFNTFVDIEKNIFNESGYYKFIVTNKYGTTKEYLLRISYNTSITIDINYYSGEKRNYTIENSGNYDFGLSGNIFFMIWEQDFDIDVTKDNTPYQIELNSSLGSKNFKLTELGNYVITIVDSCSNSYVFNVKVLDEQVVVYDDYLYGFNTEALKKDDLYTNQNVFVDKQKIVSNNIGYVGVVYTNEKGVANNEFVIYDKISQVEIDDETLLSIGNNGNGTYLVKFGDYYGNYVTKELKISNKVQIKIERLVQNSSVLEEIISNEVWSNRIINLTSLTDCFKMTINDEEITSNTYTLQFPINLGEGHFTYTLNFIDEYGNKINATLNLMKKIPIVDVVENVQVVNIDGNYYTKDSLGYTFEDTLTATYTKDNVVLMLILN